MNSGDLIAFSSEGKISLATGGYVMVDFILITKDVCITNKKVAGALAEFMKGLLPILHGRI
jgi:hypothetical protein